MGILSSISLLCIFFKVVWSFSESIYPNSFLLFLSDYLPPGDSVKSLTKLLSPIERFVRECSLSLIGYSSEPDKRTVTVDC